MSSDFPFDRREYKRWMGQAEHTIDAAKSDLKSQLYSWACFKCQQAAEYAINALLRGVGLQAPGYSLLKLLSEIKEGGSQIPEEVEEGARTLDRYYIPTRYADTFEDGSPYEYFSEKDAKRALEIAEEIIGFIQREIEKHV
ncbi:MAG: HEPN domain-containing protein [Candidatus Hodarchaeota archaeon]